MSKENKHWSQCDDKALKQLRQVRGIKKWSVIAKKLQQEFQIFGKSGKKCRQRYQNYLNSQIKRQNWTEDEEKYLFKLHNQKGNKWVQIGKILQRSDNAVKNYYHSKLRKALRRVNRLIFGLFKNEFRPLKNSIISKILQTSEDYHNPSHQKQDAIPKLCFSLKNRILSYLFNQKQELTQSQIVSLRNMIKQINKFNKTYKKKNKSKEINFRSKIRYDKMYDREILSESPQILNEKSQSILSSESQDKCSDIVLKDLESQNAQRVQDTISTKISMQNYISQQFSNQYTNPFLYNHFGFNQFYTTLQPYSMFQQFTQPSLPLISYPYQLYNQSSVSSSFSETQPKRQDLSQLENCFSVKQIKNVFEPYFGDRHFQNKTVTEMSLRANNI